MDDLRHYRNFREAVEYAKTIILKEIETWGMSHSALLAKTALGPVAQIERQEEFVQTLIESSERDASCWDALRELGERLHAEGKPRPSILSDWAADAFLKILKRPGKNRLRAMGGRDSALSEAQRKLEFKGMTRTRSTGQSDCCEKGGSACDAAGVAWNELHAEGRVTGALVGYKTVVKACYVYPVQGAVQELIDRIFRSR